MGIWGWLSLLLVGAWATHWGANQLAEPLKKLRQQWGFSEAAEATFAGLAAASPEVAMATVSVFRGVSSIGLGTSLGTNIIAIPLTVTIAYIATHIFRGVREAKSEEETTQAKETRQNPSPNKIETQAEVTEQNQPPGELHVPAEAATVQAIPYLGLVGLTALLTLPPAWRGLQPVDGWILLAAYGIYLTQALFRKRNQEEPVSWIKRELLMAAAGFLVLVIGAYLAIWATEHIAEALGLSPVIGGLFIAAPMACLPELFESWSLIRTGQLNPAVMSVIGDHAVTLTLAFLPLALVTTPIEEIRLFWVNLIFVGLMPLLYARFILHHRREPGFKLWHVGVLDIVLLIWVVTVFLGRAWLEG